MNTTITIDDRPVMVVSPDRTIPFGKPEEEYFQRVLPAMLADRHRQFQNKHLCAKCPQDPERRWKHREQKFWQLAAQGKVVKL